MAATLQDLRDALHNDSATLYSDGENTLLVTFPHRGQMMVIYVSLLENGDYVRCHIPFYLDLTRTAHRGRVIERLLELNYQLKLLKFGLDPTDGEVSVEIDMPLEDGAPTQRQMHRCMFYLTNIAMQERDRLCALYETGIYPASSDPGFVASLDRLLIGDEADETAAGTTPEFEWDDTLRPPVEDSLFADE